MPALISAAAAWNMSAGAAKRIALRFAAAVQAVLFLAGSGLAQPASGPEQVEWTVVQTGLKEIATVRFHPDGSLWIVESGKNRLLMLDHTGRRIDSLGRAGSSEYAFLNPSSLDLTNGLKTYVLDRGNSRIQVYDRRKQFLTSIASRAIAQQNQPIEPDAAGVDGLGRLFVWETGTRRLHRFKPNGQPDVLLPLPDPVHLFAQPLFAVWNDRIMAAETGGTVLFMLNQDGLVEGFRTMPAPVLDVSSHTRGTLVLTRTVLLLIGTTGKLEKEISVPREELRAASMHSSGLIAVAGASTVWLAR